MRRGALFSGLALLPPAWAVAAAGSMTGHMIGHMVAVAVAAPLIALGLSATRADPARRWPTAVNPLAMSVVELLVVWGWHLPRLRALAHDSAVAPVLEQAIFVASGVLLWASVFAADRRAAGVGALLLTSMHMTLLGALIGLAPRALYPLRHGHDPLQDQQIAGVVMLLIGGGAYLVGGLAVLARLLADPVEDRA